MFSLREFIAMVNFRWILAFENKSGTSDKKLQISMEYPSRS